jgi:hypothetical protein
VTGGWDVDRGRPMARPMGWEKGAAAYYSLAGWPEMPDRTPRPPVPQAVVMIDRPLVMAARLEQRLTMGIGQGRTGQDRTPG